MGRYTQQQIPKDRVKNSSPSLLGGRIPLHLPPLEKSLQLLTANPTFCAPLFAIYEEDGSAAVAAVLSRGDQAAGREGERQRECKVRLA